MKRLILGLALLAIPAAAQAANDGLTYEESVAHTRRCVAIGGHRLICAMTHARDEHIALGFAEVAEESCRRIENDRLYDSKNNREECAMLRAYMMQRWAPKK